MLKKARCTVGWRSIRDLNSGGATNALSHFESVSSPTFPCFYLKYFTFCNSIFKTTLVFDISAYIALFVACGCLGNIWATAHFWATLFGSAQRFCKIYTDFEDLAIFQAESFSFLGRNLLCKKQILPPKTALLCGKRGDILSSKTRRCSTTIFL